MSEDHPITIEASTARVRVTFNGKTPRSTTSRAPMCAWSC
jgi:uncharacterized protein (DUF427 family)